MDTGRILILALTFSASILNAAPDALEIYRNSIKVLSIPQIKFSVTSLLSSGSFQEKRVFSLSRNENGGESSLLICFAAPSQIRGTAMLLKKKPDVSQTYVYVPALERVRLIPKQQENEEAFGLGISYAEMEGEQGNITYIKSLVESGKPYHMICKENGSSKTYYTVSATSNVVKKMSVYDNNRLSKEIIIDDVTEMSEKTVITKWHINDFVRQETLAYTIDEASIKKGNLNPKEFSLSQLNRCKP